MGKKTKNRKQTATENILFFTARNSLSKVELEFEIDRIKF
jgi:hypothetical protein